MFATMRSLLCLLAACAAAPVPAVPAVADVVTVEVTGKAGAYTFAVTVKSPDTGCDAFADWWEVLHEDGTLAYRRILRHSHASEQPFRRGGAPVNVTEGEVIWVRAHFHSGGFGQAMTGTVNKGFSPASMPTGLGDDALTQEPLPDGCLF